MGTPFEDFVNLELPKRISTEEDGGGSGNLPVGKLLRTTGIGLATETIDPSQLNSGDSIKSKIASDNIGASRIVQLTNIDEIALADNGTFAHLNKVFGLTLTSVITGNSVDVLTFGEHTDPSWAWTEGLPLFLVANGLLSQSPPAGGFNVILGFAITATKAFMRIQQPIILI